MAPARRVAFEPRPVPLLTRSSILKILEAARSGSHSIEASLDLGLSSEPVRLAGGRASLRGLEVELEELRRASLDASERDVLAPAPGGGLAKVQFFSGSFYKLRNVEGTAPTLEIDGIHMHRISGTTPWADAASKVRAARVGPGSVVLDIATGLGYTAAHALRAGAARVVTVEADPNVLGIASVNPWSRGLASGRAELLLGDALEAVRAMPGEAFTHVIHDPPRFALSPRMYSEDMYSEILRVLRPGGILVHYTGEPGRARGRDLPGATASRLRSVGFEVLGYLPGAMCVVARRPRPRRRSEAELPVDLLQDLPPPLLHLRVQVPTAAVYRDYERAEVLDLQLPHGLRHPQLLEPVDAQHPLYRVRGEDPGAAREHRVGRAEPPGRLGGAPPEAPLPDYQPDPRPLHELGLHALHPGARRGAGGHDPPPAVLPLHHRAAVVEGEPPEVHGQRPPLPQELQRLPVGLVAGGHHLPCHVQHVADGQRPGLLLRDRQPDAALGHRRTPMCLEIILWDPSALNSAVPLLTAQQFVVNATASDAGCLCPYSTLTSSAVVGPPKPWGPISSLLTSPRISSSSLATSGSGCLSPIGLSRDLFASLDATSTPPAIPTPITTGGQGMAPALNMDSTTNLLTPFSPWMGGMTLETEGYSLPPPLKRTVRRSPSPSVSSRSTHGMWDPVLSPLFLSLIGSTAFGLSGILLVASLVASLRASSSSSRRGKSRPALAKK